VSATDLNFIPQASEFAVAAQEYRAIWEAEGERIVGALQKATSLRLEQGPIQAIVYEGVSYSGYHERPMRLRASYPLATKRATLVHELSHRLISDIAPKNVDQHPVIFLFVYDVWVELWGKEFADEQVVVESARRGRYDYKSAWRDALALGAVRRNDRWEKLRAEWQKR
jgi:hypothetical protein